MATKTLAKKTKKTVAKKNVKTTKATASRAADRARVSKQGHELAYVAKKFGVSDVTIYAWRKRFGQLEAVDVKRLRQLEHENGRLKKLLAERDLDIEILKEVAAKKW